MNRPCPPCAAAQAYIHAIDTQREAAQVRRQTSKDAENVRDAERHWAATKNQRHTCRDRAEREAA